MEPMPELLTRDEAAALCGLSPETLRRYYSRNAGPPVVKVGGRLTRAGRVRYPRAALMAWAANPTACTLPARPEGLPRFTPPRRVESRS